MQTELFEIELIIYTKMDLALNNLQKFICHKKQQINQPQKLCLCIFKDMKFLKRVNFYKNWLNLALNDLKKGWYAIEQTNQPTTKGITIWRVRQPDVRVDRVAEILQESRLGSPACEAWNRVLLLDVGAFSSHPLVPEEHFLVQPLVAYFRIESGVMWKDDWRRNITIVIDHPKHQVTYRTSIGLPQDVLMETKHPVSDLVWNFSHLRTMKECSAGGDAWVCSKSFLLLFMVCDKKMFFAILYKKYWMF